MAFLNMELYSKEIRMPTSVSVILPQDITGRTDPPKTLYLLHGRSHNHSVWQRYTSLERYAQQYHIAVIMPEVNRSFYSDMKYGVRYFHYIAQELPALCEAMFHINSAAEGRYLAGMSMGGYGCLKAALTFPKRYRGCAAISAVTDIRQHIDETPESDTRKNEFRGIFGENLETVPADDLFSLASSRKGLPLPDLYFSCGRQDHLYPEGERFRTHLDSLEIPYTFEEWDGIHDWEFWDIAIRKVLEYFFPAEKV